MLFRNDFATLIRENFQVESTISSALILLLTSRTTITSKPSTLSFWVNFWIAGWSIQTLKIPIIMHSNNNCLCIVFSAKSNGYFFNTFLWCTQKTYIKNNSIVIKIRTILNENIFRFWKFITKFYKYIAS